MKRLLTLVLMVLITSGLFAQARPSFDQIAPGTGKFSDGTAAAPSITFGSDADTGLYRYGANQIGITTGAASHSALLSSGDFKLMTTTTVDGSDDHCLWLGHDAENRGAYLSLYGNEFPAYQGMFQVGIGDGGFFRITGNAGAEALRVPANTGNLIIGDTVDDGVSKLQVNGSVRLIGGAAPGSPTEGTMYFNSTDKHFYGWNGTAWVQLDN